MLKITSASAWMIMAHSTTAGNLSKGVQYLEIIKEEIWCHNLLRDLDVDGQHNLDI